MISKLHLSAVALAAGMAVGAPAQAFTLTNADGSFANFDGFDWSALGTAYTVGFVPAAGDSFTLNYFSSATAISAGGVVVPPSMDVNPNGALGAGKLYEYTIVASINEQVVGCAGNTCEFNVTGGSWTIYYDVAGNANHAAKGTGYADGVALMSGTWDVQPGGTFTVSGSNGFGIASLSGNVTATNPVLMAPPAEGTHAFSTLQLNLPTFGWSDPGGFGGVAWADLGAEVIFQADANQSFVPEPGVAALLGIGLIGMGVNSVRRRKASA